MSEHIQKAIDALVDERTTHALRIRDIDTALEVLGRIGGTPSQTRRRVMSEDGRANIRAAQRERHAIREALGLPYRASNAEVAAAQAARSAVQTAQELVAV